MAEHCCETMRYNVEYTCDVHPDRFDCPDCLIDYNERSRRYGLIILNDAGGGVITIAYCPWCGTKLPEVTDEMERLSAAAAIERIRSISEHNRHVLGVDGFRRVPGGYVASLDLVLDLSTNDLSVSEAAAEAERFVIDNAAGDVTFEVTA